MTAAVPSPGRPLVIDAPAHWDCVDFIADLHLDATRPHTFAAWAAFLRDTPAQAVFVLGDLFEAWVGDDAALQADSFEAHGAQVLREAAGRRWIGFMAGNRDFLVGDGLLAPAGVQHLPDPTELRAFGRQVLLSHGDALCLADEGYQRFRAQVRDPAWQAGFLARPLAERRALAQAMRDASREHQRDPSTWADVDPEAAVSWLRETGCTALVHGHTHRPGSRSLAPGLDCHVLADWEFDGHGPARAQVLRLTCGGFTRIDLGSTNAHA